MTMQIKQNVKLQRTTISELSLGIPKQRWNSETICIFPVLLSFKIISISTAVYETLIVIIKHLQKSGIDNIGRVWYGDSAQVIIPLTIMYISKRKT